MLLTIECIFRKFVLPAFETGFGLPREIPSPFSSMTFLPSSSGLAAKSSTKICYKCCVSKFMCVQYVPYLLGLNFGSCGSSGVAQIFGWIIFKLDSFEENSNINEVGEPVWSTRDQNREFPNPFLLNWWSKNIAWIVGRSSQICFLMTLLLWHWFLRIFCLLECIPKILKLTLMLHFELAI